MSTEPGHPLQQPHITADDAWRLYCAWAGFGCEMVKRPLALSGTAGVRLADAVARGILGAESPRALARMAAREAGQLAVDMLAVPSSAAATAAAHFDEAQAPSQDRLARALAGTDPVATITRVDVDPNLAEAQWRELTARSGVDVDAPVPEFAPTTGAPFLLPARVLDASQAWAAWFVPLDAARRLLAEACETGHQPPEVLDAFAPVAVGDGGVLVSLVASDYRASDFGVVQEIGLSLTVSPRAARFPGPGQLFLRLIVTHPYSLGAARQIWGIRKDLHDNASAEPRSRFQVAYGADRVRFGQGALQSRAVRSSGTLQLAFPRLGRGRSDRVPGLIHSMVAPHGPPAAAVAPARSVLMRSGTGEGVQVRGDVRLTLPADRAAGLQAGCLCRGGMACLCDTLRGLGLDRRRPAANGWTERLTCTLAEPVRIGAQSSDGAGNTSSKA
ncbi:hypothetical protein ILP92_16220 [Maribius pontilimi]|uniref:Uncharacterized protein n=1 Tax=Palleronia pontilimi TaxID=1964209 RepID=A0A934MFA2_9RHOB|nr:hypothetical protein [Palleronia pontilimi]MBJ3764296.1 hypothetical protein [Palleronia pontilimi]